MPWFRSATQGVFSVWALVLSVVALTATPPPSLDLHEQVSDSLFPGDASDLPPQLNIEDRLRHDAQPPTPIPVVVPPTGAAILAPARPPRPTDYLRSEDGLISTSVGYYYSLQQSVPAWEAVLDLRMKMVSYYFDGHNPGVFSSLLSEHTGSVIDYWDGVGTVHRFRIIAVRSWDRYQGEPPPVSGSVVAQFQTCRTSDGSVDWIYDAVAA